MLEDHSVGLLATSVLSVVIYFVGLVINLSNLARQYISIPLSVIPSILGENATESTYVLPVSLADWSVPIWGVVYVYQGSWLAYAVTGICRKTAAGPAYNNPKLLPVQIHIFFSLAVLLQVGWLISMDKQNLGFALLLVLIATGFAVASLGESYRVLASTQSLLMQQERTWDLWAVRVLAQNGLAVFSTWLTLHACLTFVLFLSFGVDTRHVSARTSSLVEICFAGFLVFVYVLSDLTVFDRFSRFVLAPYLAFILFHAAQMDKYWPDTHAAIFVLLALCMTFTFLAFFLKVIVLLWRQRPRREQEPKVTVSRPLPPDMEEEAYLLDPK
ncbi:uncharacterized protein LOC143290188 [Babylonia areolata]|uniref:uncharacterized protein LOC143290188 n=1 Tax=Babylonia areolata TaxID=304850 RepID=UPI003FD428CA